MKKTLKIVGRTLLVLGLIVYIALALANYSLVQSYVGAKASTYFSREWGGTVRIGAIHASLFDHLVLNDVLLVSPDGDTIVRGERISVSFRRFPFSDGTLTLKEVGLRNVYYHFSQPAKGQMNLRYIIDYFKQRRKPREKEHSGKPFRLTVETLTMQNVHYKMDLKPKPRRYNVGVDIPHMEFLDINGKIKDICVQGKGEVVCRIVHMSTRERSGFTVRDLQLLADVGPRGIHAKNMRIELENSVVLGDADLVWPGNDWHGMSGYVTTVDQWLDLKEGTHVAMSDVAYWAPTLWGNTLEASVRGTAFGTVDSLCASGLHVEWGEGASADLSCTLRGLPKVDTSYGHVEVSHLHASVADADQILRNFVKRYKGLPKQLASLDYINLDAEVEGGYDHRRQGKSLGSIEAKAKLDLHTGWGDAIVDAAMRQSMVEVHASSDNLQLSSLGSDWIEATGFDLELNGQMPAHLANWKSLRADLRAGLRHPRVKGGRLNNIDLLASMRGGIANAELTSADTALGLRLVAEADLRDTTPLFGLDADIARLDLVRFGLAKAEGRLGEAGGKLQAHISGTDPDLMTGTLQASDLRLGEAAISHVSVRVDHPDADKLITLSSDLADLRLGGHFRYADLGTAARYFCQLYLPPMLLADTARVDTALLSDCNFTYAATWKDAAHQLPLLVPGVEIASGTRLDGSYNFTEQLKLVLRSDGLKIGGLTVSDIGLSGRTFARRYFLHAESGTLMSGSSTLLDQLRVDIGSQAVRTTAIVAWGNPSSTSDGEIRLRLADSTISIDRSALRLRDEQWQLALADGHFDGHALSLADLCLFNESSRINASLSLLGTDRDHLELQFDQFDLSTPSDLFLSESGFDLTGRIDGRFDLYGLHQTPYFNANLTIDSCTVANQELGHVSLKSNWNAELNMLNLNVDNRQLTAYGWVGLGGDKELHIDIGFDSLDLAMATPILSSFTSRFDGRLQGQALLGGTLSEPLLLGEAYVDGGALRIDPTGVTYYFSDSIRLGTGQVHFDNFRVIDPEGNIARIDGEVNYHGLKEIGLNLHVQTDNLMVLNLGSGEQYYGKVGVAAEGTVTGTPNDLRIGLRASTSKGSELFVPIDDRRTVKAQNYIEFYSDQPQPEEEEAEEVVTPKRSIYIDADLSLTPDLQLTIPITFSEVDLTVKATGTGDVHLGLPVGGVADVKGSYELQSGSMSVLLISLIEKSFTIEPGSNLNFQGKPQESRFDISATHATRVNLSTLTGSLSTLDNTQKYLQVENVISVAGTMQEPTIGFDLRLPNADQSVSDEVFAYIDRNNEVDMLNQTISLLVRGRFYNVSGIDEGASSGLSSGLSLVASTLSSAMSDMVQFVDVSVDYKAANDITNEQLDVNLSRDWGRWTIESTLGYGGNSRNLDASNSTNTPVIDAMLSYRINPLMYLYVYNRTNTNDYTRIDLPYKQGLGLRLSKDFDRWGDLFRRRNKKK